MKCSSVRLVGFAHNMHIPSSKSLRRWEPFPTKEAYIQRGAVCFCLGDFSFKFMEPKNEILYIRTDNLKR